MIYTAQASVDEASVDERIAPQPVVTDATPAPVVDYDASTLAVIFAASTSSSALTPPECVMLSSAANQLQSA